jgi:hypothetical protein
VTVLAALLGLAHATVGGAHEFRVLGHDPVDHKVFLASDDATGEVSRLHYYALRAPPAEQRADRPIAVKSWYQGTYDEIEAAFPGRMAALQARLDPLPAADREGLVMEVHEGALALCPKGAGDGGPADERRGLAEAKADGRAGGRYLDESGALVFVCRESRVTVTWAGHRATTELSGWGGVHVAQAFMLPGGGRLVMLRHRGVTFESGYDEDVPLLLGPGGNSPGEGTPSP